MWLLLACGSAVFAGLTSILAKVGIRKTDSDLATALRTVVVLFFAWGMVFVVGAQHSLAGIAPHALLFLVLSGLATGGSWLCYYRALQLGSVNQVTPVDKSSVILTILFAMMFLGERQFLAARLAALGLIGAGTFLMIEKKREPVAVSAACGTPQEKKKRIGWLGYALASAVLAAAQTILAKVGVQGVDSNLATAIRTVVVLVLAWGIVFARGKQHQLAALDKHELLFLGLSGLATGASWLCYYQALQLGSVSAVAPIDKLSVLLTVLFSCVFLKEKLSPGAVLGLVLLTGGTLWLAFL